MRLAPRRVGILGAGQLGSMLAEALLSHGAEVAFYDPDPGAPAVRRFSRGTVGAWDDLAAIRAFAEQVDVLTYEFENVETGPLRSLTVPIFPSLDVLATTQHRAREKSFCRDNGIPHPRFEVAEDEAGILAKGEAFGAPFLVKTSRGGYDGKGQRRVETLGDLPAAAKALGGAGGVVLEELVPFVREVSVIAARDEKGNVLTFPVFENAHARGILDVTLMPARVSDVVEAEARRIATRCAELLGVVGLLTTEMFVTADDRVLVNEFAPRPHNSGHVTRAGATSSQFDVHARILLGMPMGQVELLPGHWAMANLLGDLWEERQKPDLDWAALLSEGVVDVCLYGKHDARVGRKMGHLSVVAPSADAALHRARDVRRVLSTP